MKSEKMENVIKVEDDDDVVILGDFMPKPMISHVNRKRKRHVELRKSKSVDESLIITQKVKVKKRKHRCIFNADKNVKKKLSGRPHDLTKNNSTYVKVSYEDRKHVKKSSHRYERIAPLCLRPSCIDIRFKIESNIRKGIEKMKSHHVFPRGLKRLLSPISSNSMGNDMSISMDSSAEISLDTSSFYEEKESKLDTLIKRTRDRDRRNEVARTQYLCTPPHHTPTPKDIIEDKDTCTDYKPPCTSTPKYEEKIHDNKSMANMVDSNTKTDETKIKNDSFFKEIQVEISPIKSFGNVSTTNTNKEQYVNIPPGGNYKKLDRRTYSEEINKELQISTSNTNYDHIMSISDCDNTHQKFSQYTNNVLSNINFAQNSNKINISHNDITNQLSQLSEDTRVQQKDAEYTNNTVSNINLVQKFDKINLSLSNNENTKQPSLGHDSFSNDQKFEENGKPILNNNFVFQNLNYIPVSKDMHIQYAEYTHNAVPSTHLEQNHDKLNISLSHSEKGTRQLSLSHNEISKELVQNNNPFFSNKNCDQNVEVNGQSILHNNYFSQNLNLVHIPVITDTHYQHLFAEYTPNNVLHSNLEQNHDKINLSHSHNEVVTKHISLSKNEDIIMQLSQDHNSLSQELKQNHEQEFTPTSFSKNNCYQNLEGNGKSILQDNYGLSQNLYQDHIPYSEVFEQHNKIEYMNTSISNKNNDQIIENKVESYNNFKFCEPENQEYTFSDELIQRERSNYMHTSLFNKKCDQIIEDTDNCIPHNDHRFPHYPNQNSSLFSEERRRHKNTGYSHEGFATLGNKSTVSHNESRFTKRDDVKFLDERGSKSEYINTEHKEKSTYHYSTHYRHPSRDQSPFIDETIEHRKYESTHREYQIIEGNISRNHSNRDKFDNRSYGDEPIVRDDYEYARKRTSSVNYEDNAGDIWVSDFHEKNCNERSKREHKTVFDDNIKYNASEFIYTENNRDCDREFDDINMSLPYDNNFSKQKNRNPNVFFEKTQHNRYDNCTVMTDKGYEKHIKNRKMSTSYKEIKNNIDFDQDMRMPSSYNSGNKNKYNQYKNKFKQPHSDHRSFFEEIHFQYKTSNYTHKHTVYSNPKYEYNNSKKNMFFTNNKGNKPYNRNRNIPNNQTSNYVQDVRTVSKRKYKKVVSKRETFV